MIFHMFRSKRLRPFILSALLGFCAATLPGVLVSTLFAEETMKESVEIKVDEIKKDAKKTGRKIKKTVRDATGNKSLVEDVKDSVHNAEDEVEHGVKTIKKKVD